MEIILIFETLVECHIMYLSVCVEASYSLTSENNIVLHI